MDKMKLINYLMDTNTHWVKDMTISREWFETLLEVFDLNYNIELRDLMMDYGFWVEDLF